MVVLFDIVLVKWKEGMGTNTGKVVGNDPLATEGICWGRSADKRRREQYRKDAKLRARRFLIEERAKALKLVREDNTYDF